MTILVCVFFVLAFYYKVCQKDKESTSTYPCANTVSAFIVNSDGTTTIDYQQYIESGTGYKRVVKIKLMCDESKYPGETDGVSEDYQPLDSTYVGIIALYLILSIKRAWYVAGKYPTFN